jgi:uncharacterized protein (TIGR02118 family)
MIKAMSLLTRKAGMSREEFMRAWVDEHAPMALSVPGLRRYVLQLIVDEPVRADIPAQQVTADGIAELWFDDVAAMQKVLASPEMKQLRAHGTTFIGQIKMFLTEEKVIIDRVQKA